MPPSDRWTGVSGPGARQAIRSSRGAARKAMAVSRRDLLSRLGFGLTFLPAIAMAPRSLVGSLLFEPDGELVPVKPVPPNLFTHDGKALVAIVHGQDPIVMLRAGLDMIGGIARLALKGKRVLIKPNIVNDRPPPTTTSPSVIAAVVQVVREAEAADVTVTAPRCPFWQATGTHGLPS